MGIESDQVVYEYLSRVGDVAQQRHLSSATRMRLVSELRNEIDRCRARAAVDSPAAVRRILDRLGSPDDIVAAAGGGAAGPQAPASAVPVQRDPGESGKPAGGRAGKSGRSGPEGSGRPGRSGSGGAGGSGTSPEAGDVRQERPRGLRRAVPRPDRPRTGPPPSGAASPPHLATAGELGGAATRPDWWRTHDSPFGIGDDVPGFVGGVEIPDLLRPPPRRDPADPVRQEVPVSAPAADADGEGTVRRPRLALLPRRPAGWHNPLLLLAAALLAGGALFGNWFALLLGWVIAYGSRRLTPAESKWAVMGLPGLALAAGLVWLWGRDNGRWGSPVAQGHMNEAIAEAWPWVVRAAAVLSALFLVWRSRRRR